MLPGPQGEVCFSCHGSQAGRDRQVMAGVLDSTAQPQLMSSTLTKPYTHPITEKAYSRHEVDAVTCSSCHSPHRGLPPGAKSSAGLGVRRLSTRDRGQTEVELCTSCHEENTATPSDRRDVGGLLRPRNRSYHPVKAPSAERSPSLAADRAGREIECTDCHGNNDPNGIQGPHGSSVRYLLKAEYRTADGGTESAASYALCYGCHERDSVLDSPVFPEHRLHVVDHSASCATCHNPHGSVNNRALIRFGEQAELASVAPSGKTGRLEFDSAGPGSGTCHLTCHGYDHGPVGYGAAAILPPAGSTQP